MSDPATLRDEAISIWQAGVKAADATRLVRSVVQSSDGDLIIAGERYDLSKTNTIGIVGAGKAGVGMARGIEKALTPTMARKVSGWINVPDGFDESLDRIHLHPGRPQGMNKPTSEAVRGTRAILQIVGQLEPDDLCIVLLSGGGSALLTSPRREIGLADIAEVTTILSEGGASISELNLLRRHLSTVKGGRLREAIACKRVVTLIISDVIGDPPEVIASGPTMLSPFEPEAALRVLEKFDPKRNGPSAIYRFLEDQIRGGEASSVSHSELTPARHVVVGNNRTALEAAAEKATELGYTVLDLGSENEGEARQQGAALYRLAAAIRAGEHELKTPVCVLSGGEPVVHLSDSQEDRKGGRNQELVLGAINAAWSSSLEQVAILSGGTDGEDGPTDAAGAFVNQDMLRKAFLEGMTPDIALAANNSYPFFEKLDGLLKTGITGTNVMDLRVAVIR